MVIDENPNSRFLVACNEWFSQGDVFNSVPLGPLPEEAAWPQEASEGPSQHAALLVTHGCALDKKSGAGAIRIERMHFLPLENVAAQSADKQSVLRRAALELEPSEVLYLGEVPVLNFEAFAVLSNIHTVPARVFDLAWVDVVDMQGDVVDSRLSGGRHHERVATLSDEHGELLKDKLNVYWTRRAPQLDE